MLVLVLAAAIMIPTVNRILLRAQKDIESTSLNDITNAYYAYSIVVRHPFNLRSLPPGCTTHYIAFILAKRTWFNDATRYFTSNDPLAPAVIPKVIISGNTSTATAPDPDFANATLSVVMVANVSNDNPSTIIIAWTRGLQPNGTWSANSPWGGTGGHIAFLDGHVVWFNKLDAADPTSSLLKYGTNIPTANITEALPPGAVILSAEPWHAAK